MSSPNGNVKLESSPTAATQSDIDDILKKKRKVREPRACYPCRHRKVKCDSNLPCRTCVERNHADICSFTPPAKRRDTGEAHGSDEKAKAPVTLTKEDWDRLCGKLGAIEKSISELKHETRRASATPSTLGNHAESTANAGSPRKGFVHQNSNGPSYVKAMDMNEQNQMTGQNIHLGGGSVPALIKALKSGGDSAEAVQNVFGNNVLQYFALDDESATYPFISLWGQPQDPAAKFNDIAKILPSDAECLDLFKQYRKFAWVAYPAVVDIERFESELLTFLSNRTFSSQDADYGVTDNLIYGRGAQWVAMLFTVLASGSQYSTLPKKNRDLLAQVYTCCAFECLRLVNYLSNASLEVVQALLVLGNILATAMNAGAAWAMLGLTLRLSQSLGLHRSSEVAKPNSGDIEKAKIWWALLWQDSLLCQSYDRASAAASADCPFPPSEETEKGGRDFRETMYRIRKVGLDTVRNRVALQSIEERLARCVDLREEIELARADACDHLRDLSSCKSVREQSEYWILYLHASYMTSELCRPAISPSTAEFDRSGNLKRLCMEHLMNTVEAYLGLFNACPIHTRSWSATHRCLSSALLLGILGEQLRNSRAKNLLSKLAEIFADTVASDGTADFSAPILRSMTALQKLNTPEARKKRPLDDSETKSALDGYTIDFSQNLDLGGFEAGSYFSPSPLTGFEDDSSPYALMSSIVWGPQTNGPRPIA